MPLIRLVAISILLMCYVVLNRLLLQSRVAFKL